MKKSFVSFINLFLFFFICIPLFAEDVKGLQIKELKGNEGKRWAICIGIDDYWDTRIADLKKARNDAKGLADVFRSIGQFNYVYAMTDDLDAKDKDYPSKFNIEGRIDYVMKMAGADDLIVFFFSGHGIADAAKKSYLVAADARPDADKVFGTSVALDDVVNKLKAKKIKKSLLLIDACREEMSESKSVKTPNFNANIYSKAEIAAIFYATKAGWFSYEDTKSDYGIFTRFLIEGLKGAADADADAIVSFSELEKYVMEAVFDYAVGLDLDQQPYTKINEEKFGDLALTATGNAGTAIVEKTKQENPSDKDMILVKAGGFKMGSDDEKAEKDEKPAHEVHITIDFLMAKYEVTVKEWREYLNKTGADFNWESNSYGDYPVLKYSSSDNCPINSVSWDQAIAYCNWKSKVEGLEPCYSGSGSATRCDFSRNGYRLPTEAEWEYAAQGGNSGKAYTYAGSNTGDDIAWYIENAEKKAHSVGQKQPNELGIYDLNGNVWEWCWDFYGENYYASSPEKDPGGPASGEGRVCRGGSWSAFPSQLRISCRGWNKPFNRGSGIGFRMVRSVKQITG